MSVSIKKCKHSKEKDPYRKLKKRFTDEEIEEMKRSVRHSMMLSGKYVREDI